VTPSGISSAPRASALISGVTPTGCMVTHGGLGPVFHCTASFQHVRA
jgi:hypothetical protein